jgi:hypothetical protein
MRLPIVIVVSVFYADSHKKTTMLNVVMLNAVMLNVVAPLKHQKFGVPLVDQL